MVVERFNMGVLMALVLLRHKMRYTKLPTFCSRLNIRNKLMTLKCHKVSHRMYVILDLYGVNIVLSPEERK